MKPLKLKITGLNSFIDEQIIDFKILTEKGLFGIFGPTGSGKSTIIDAITLSMYGKIPRNSKDFINTQSPSLSLFYQFEIGVDGTRKVYVVERSIKKDQKSGGYKTTLVRLRELKDNTNLVLAEKDRDVQQKILEIIGLTAEDFTRSVVLPQGKFSEFLKLTGKERRDMLERIFGLEKYGNILLLRIREEKKKKVDMLNEINAKLSQHEGVSETAIEDLNKKLIFLKTEEEKLEKEKSNLDIECNRLKSIWEKQQELNQLLLKKEMLDLKVKEVEDKRKKLEKAEKAISIKPYIDSLDETYKKINVNQKEVEEYTNKLKEKEVLFKKAQEDYDIALKEKEEKIPVIIEKEEKIKRARTLKEEIKKVANEKESLLKEFKDLKNNIYEVEKNLKSLNDFIEGSKKNLYEKEKKINNIKIKPEIKEKIFSAFEIQKEFERIDKEIKEKEGKILNLKEVIKKQKDQFKEMDELLINKKLEIRNIENKLKELENKKPPTNDELLHIQETLERKKAEVLELKEKINLKIELENNLKEIFKIKETKVSEIKAVESELINKNNILEKIKIDIDKLIKNNMAGELADGLKEGIPCPVCGSLHHEKLAEKADEHVIKEKQILKDKIEKEIIEYQNKVVELKNYLLKIEAREEIYKKDYEKLINDLKDIEVFKIEENVKVLENTFTNSKRHFEVWNSSKEKLELLLKKLIEERTSLDLKYTRVKESINKDLNILQELESSTDDMLINHDKLKNKLAFFIEDLGIYDFKKEVDKINNFDREIEVLRKDIEKLKNVIEDTTIKRDELTQNFNILLIRKGQIEEIGKEKKKIIDEKQREYDILIEGKNIEEYQKEIIQSKERIINAESALKELLEKIRLEKQNIENKKISAHETHNLLYKIFMEQKEKLETALKEKGFKDKDEVLENILTNESIKSIEIEIKDFDNNYVSVNRDIERLENILKCQKINENELRQLIEKTEDLGLILNQKRKEIGATEKTIQDMQENLAKVLEFNKQKKELENIVDILKELDNMFYGNRFVDFIAAKQLKYITFTASKRLKEISKGRYALEIDGENNFVIRDDYNGGVRRSVDTLSGGETFLTSLSLALALSSHIQLKGKAPLEFFFLDEGFGSLDQELLDIVMTSLERLKKDNMVVGIISHVDELKDRVPIKLIITPPNVYGEGSKVKIEYT
ncbi:MAG: SbcC/MukB-like Walker B domain-containing protein [Thermoanaerobacteraceae bacterium]